jgi:hypothetical protein
MIPARGGRKGQRRGKEESRNDNEGREWRRTVLCLDNRAALVRVRIEFQTRVREGEVLEDGFDTDAAFLEERGKGRTVGELARVRRLGDDVVCGFR